MILQKSIQYQGVGAGREAEGNSWVKNEQNTRSFYQLGENLLYIVYMNSGYSQRGAASKGEGGASAPPSK